MSGSSDFKLDAALRRIHGRGPALILTHDNPDPDSLAAAEALGYLLAQELGIKATIAMGGIIGRAENRAMVEALGIGAVPVESIDFASYPLVALVDTQPNTGNNALPRGRAADIVIDHHPAREESRAAPWCDIRPALGASTTIVYRYLVERKLPIDARLATLLLYAIKSETRDLGREATAAEKDAYVALIPRADHALLHAIANPKVGAERFAALDRALHRATLYGDVCAVNLGALDYPDLVAEIADLLLPLKGARWVLCVGRYERKVFLSLRTDVHGVRCGELVKKVVGPDGTAGGHGLTAGGRLHAEVDDDEALGEAYERLLGRLVGELRIAVRTPRPLLPPS